MTETDEIPGLPAIPERRLPGRLADLAESAQAYARAGRAPNTQRAYASDWRHFAGWCRRQGVPTQPADPRVVGLYLTACVSRAAGDRASVATLERRLSALVWNYKQRGEVLDRRDRHISEVMAGIRRQHGRPAAGKEAVLAADLLAMLDTLPHDLRGLRDRAILLVGFAGGLRRSEIVALIAHLTKPRTEPAGLRSRTRACS
jgi:site-specific recombinase XerD